jgi:carbon monoxide dehydrogenase subunit G
LSKIRWPDAHSPAGAAVHETNTAITHATPEAVWAWLVRPDRWSAYYGNASKVRHISGPWPEIALGTTFSWVTFHTKVTTEVTEFEPFHRLAWTGGGLGSVGHHAWLLTASGDSQTEIHTEETQRGTVSKLFAPRLRRNMHSWHQKWVDQLAEIAATERRPAD